MRRTFTAGRTACSGSGALLALCALCRLAGPARADASPDLEAGRARAGVSLGLEAGQAVPSRLDVRIPGSTGTRISLVDELGADAAAYVRVRADAVFAERHVLALTVAPLRFEASDRLKRDVTFDRYVFPAGTEVQAEYRFDTYRATYRYRFDPGPRLRLALGATLLLRDAEVSLETREGRAVSTNVGVVPLLSAELEWRLAPRLLLCLDGDALAAPQGRAIDVLLATRYRASEQWTLQAGYRVVEGGADNDDVYTFAFAHLWNVGVSLTF